MFLEQYTRFHFGEENTFRDVSQFFKLDREDRINTSCNLFHKYNGAKVACHLRSESNISIRFTPKNSWIYNIMTLLFSVTFD